VGGGGEGWVERERGGMWKNNSREL